MNIHPEQTFKSNTAVVTRRIAGETLLVPVTGKLADLADMFALNESGAHIWAMLDGHTPVVALCESLVATFEVERDLAWG